MLESPARQIDQPRKWAIAFGATQAITAAFLVSQEYGLRNALLAALVMGVAGAAFGWVWGSGIRFLFGLSGGLDRPVRHPDRWGRPLRCTGCEWRTTPEGPWTRRDCLEAPVSCPHCTSAVIPVVPDCPNCGTCSIAPGSWLTGMASQVRWPRNLEAGLWGHVTCRECRCSYDQWGRRVE